MSDGRRAVRVTVTGRVQGVWFRAWTVREATRLGLDGWVRNRADGGVEALIAGSEEALDKMLALLHRGPPAATVDKVDVAPAGDPGPSGFAQRPSV